MKRVYLPAGHNHTTAHHKRTALAAFPCNAQEARAFEGMPLHVRVLASLVACGWFVVLMLLGAAVLTGCEASAEAVAVRSAREDAAAMASREWVGLRVCQGRSFTWENDKTLVCGQQALQEKRP